MVNLVFLILAVFFIQKNFLFNLDQIINFDLLIFLKKLDKSIEPKYKKAFVWLLIITYAVASYFIFSQIFFPDDFGALQLSYEAINSVDHNGRWFKSFIFNHLLQGEFRMLHSISLITTYLLISICALLIAKIFDLKQFIPIFLVGLLFNLNPFLNYFFSYSLDIWSTGISLFLVCLGCFLVIKKTAEYYLIALILFTLSNSIYQINFIFAFLVIALWFLYQLMNTKNFEQLFLLAKKSVVHFLVVILAFVFAHNLAKINFSLMDYDAQGRLAQAYFSVDFDLLVFRFTSIFDAFIKLEIFTHIPALFLIFLVFVLICFLLYIYLIFIQKHFNTLKPTTQNISLLVVNFIIVLLLFNLQNILEIQLPQIIYLDYLAVGLYLILVFYAMYLLIYVSHVQSSTLIFSLSKTIIFALVLLCVPIFIFAPKLLGLSLPLQALYPANLLLVFFVIVGLEKSSPLLKNIIFITVIFILIQTSLWLNLYAFKASLQTQGDIANASQIISRIQSNPKFSQTSQPINFYIVGTQKLSINSWNSNRQAFATDWSKYAIFKKLFHFKFKKLSHKHKQKFNDILFLQNAKSYPHYNAIQFIENTAVLVLDERKINPSFELKNRLINNSSLINKWQDYQVFYNQKHHLLLLEKQNCTQENQVNSLFLLSYPHDSKNLTSYNKAIFKDYNYYLFDFENTGKFQQGECVYSLKLPKYQQKKIVLGQNLKDLKWDKPLWQQKLNLELIRN